LGEIDRVSEIIDGKERCRPLAGCWREDWRVEKGKPVTIEVIAARFHDFAAYAKERMLARGTQPEMAMIKQKSNPVFFRGNGVVVCFLDDLEVFDCEFKPDRRARVGSHGTGDSERRFLRQVISKLEHLRGNLSFENNTLDDACAIADLQEV
jgi:hypothetical protein